MEGMPSLCGTMGSKSQDPVLPCQPVSAAEGGAAASAPWPASAGSASSPSAADSAAIAGSSGSQLQGSGLSRSWDLDWGLGSGPPQTVDPKEEKGGGRLL